MPRTNILENIENQPFFAKLQEVDADLTDRMGSSVFNLRNHAAFESMITRPELRAAYIDGLTELIDDVDERTAVKSMIEVDFDRIGNEGLLTGLIGGEDIGTEGLNFAMNSSKDRVMDMFNPTFITSMISKSQIMSQYTLKSNPTGEYYYRWEEEFLVDPESGDLIPMWDLDFEGNDNLLSTDLIEANKISLRTQAESSLPECANVVAIERADFDNNTAHRYIKVGSTGNVFTQAALDLDSYEIQQGMAVRSVAYVDGSELDAEDPAEWKYAIATKVMKSNADTGNLAFVQIRGWVNLGDDEKDFVTMEVNVDDGEYFVLQTGKTTGRIIKAIEPEMWYKNLTNDEKFPVTRSRQFQIKLSGKKNKPFGIHYDKEFDDSFKALTSNGNYVGYVAFFAERVMKLARSQNDQRLEKFIISKFAKNPSDFLMYDKLRGGKDTETFNANISTPMRTDDIYGFARDAFKLTLDGLLEDVEMQTRLPDDVKRNWVGLGYSKQINWIIDNLVTNNNESEAGTTKNGFHLEGKYGYVNTTEGRKVLMFSSRMPRINKGDRQDKIHLVMKTNNEKCPMAYYSPSKIRVRTKRNNEYTNIDGQILMDWEDDVQVLTQVQATMAVSVNKRSAGADISNFVTGR